MATSSSNSRYALIRESGNNSHRGVFVLLDSKLPIITTTANVDRHSEIDLVQEVVQRNTEYGDKIEIQGH